MDVSGLTEALTAIEESLRQLQGAVTGLGEPSCIDWIALGAQVVLAGLTIAAVVYASKSAKAAADAADASRRTADAAETSAQATAESVKVSVESLARDELRDYLQEFDSAGYFMRFWRLDMLTRDPDGSDLGSLRFDVYRSRDGHPVTEHALGPSDRSALPAEAVREKGLEYRRRLAKGGDLSDIVLDALGPELSPRRADMYAVYYFALKLGAFCERYPSGTDYLTQVFGRQLLGVFINHRLLAARLLPRVSKKHLPNDYYARAYGLHDPIYARLVASLFGSAKHAGVLDKDMTRHVPEVEQYVSQLGGVSDVVDNQDDLEPDV